MRLIYFEDVKVEMIPRPFQQYQSYYLGSGRLEIGDYPVSPCRPWSVSVFLSGVPPVFEQICRGQGVRCVGGKLSLETSVRQGPYPYPTLLLPTTRQKYLV